MCYHTRIHRKGEHIFHFKPMKFIYFWWHMTTKAQTKYKTATDFLNTIQKKEAYNIGQTVENKHVQIIS